MDCGYSESGNVSCWLMLPRRSIESCGKVNDQTSRVPRVGGEKGCSGSVALRRCCVAQNSLWPAIAPFRTAQPQDTDTHTDTPAMPAEKDHSKAEEGKDQDQENSSSTVLGKRAHETEPESEPASNGNESGTVITLAASLGQHPLGLNDVLVFMVQRIRN